MHQQWEQIKAKEQADAGERRSVLRGVPRALPALLRAHEIGTRVARGRIRVGEGRRRGRQDRGGSRRAAPGGRCPRGSTRTEEEMGDLLFSIANLARKLGIDAESALRKANEKFTKRFTAVEERLHARGRSVHEATLEEMERSGRSSRVRPPRASRLPPQDRRSSNSGTIIARPGPRIVCAKTAYLSS